MGLVEARVQGGQRRAGSSGCGGKLHRLMPQVTPPRAPQCLAGGADVGNELGILHILVGTRNQRAKSPEFKG